MHWGQHARKRSLTQRFVDMGTFRDSDRPPTADGLEGQLLPWHWRYRKLLWIGLGVVALLVLGALLLWSGVALQYWGWLLRRDTALRLPPARVEWPLSSTARTCIEATKQLLWSGTGVCAVAHKAANCRLQMIVVRETPDATAMEVVLNAQWRPMRSTDTPTLIAKLGDPTRPLDTPSPAALMDDKRAFYPEVHVDYQNDLGHRVSRVMRNKLAVCVQLFGTGPNAV